MSDNSRWILLLAREPLKHSNADLSNARDTLALIQDMVINNNNNNNNDMVINSNNNNNNNNNT